LSNEEKTNDYENFEKKRMIYMKILNKRGDSREKGGGGNEIHAPCACGNKCLWKKPRNIWLESRNIVLLVYIQIWNSSDK
jgi:hypothetical protein